MQILVPGSYSDNIFCDEIIFENLEFYKLKRVSFIKSQQLLLKGDLVAFVPPCIINSIQLP